MAKKLNEILRDLREDHDITQEIIAKYLGVSQQTYSNYENGRREIPIAVVISLAKFYQVSTDYLLNSDTSYLGNIDMTAPYIDDLTLHDFIYDLQKLDNVKRKSVAQFVHFLNNDK